MDERDHTDLVFSVASMWEDMYIEYGKKDDFDVVDFTRAMLGQSLFCASQMIPPDAVVDYTNRLAPYLETTNKKPVRKKPILRVVK